MLIFLVRSHDAISSSACSSSYHCQSLLDETGAAQKRVQSCNVVSNYSSLIRSTNVYSSNSDLSSCVKLTNKSSDCKKLHDLTFSLMLKMRHLKLQLCRGQRRLSLNHVLYLLEFSHFSPGINLRPCI